MSRDVLTRTGGGRSVAAMVLSVVVAVVFVVAVAALFVRTRRYERDVELPARQLTDEERHQAMTRGAAAANTIGGGAGPH